MSKFIRTHKNVETVPLDHGFSKPRKNDDAMEKLSREIEEGLTDLVMRMQLKNNGSKQQKARRKAELLASKSHLN